MDRKSKTSASKTAWLRALGDNRGAAALEFALVAVPLICLILAAVQTAIIMFYDQALQTATEKSARQLMTGSVQDSGLNQAAFKSLVCANAPLFRCSGLMVDVQSASSFSSISTSALAPTYNGSGAVTNAWTYNPGSAGDIVILRVMYDWPVFGGPLAVGLANQSNGAFLMVGTAVFKNEPYQ
jgi:Flp pilus assembly protein TadG